MFSPMLEPKSREKISINKCAIFFFFFKVIPFYRTNLHVQIQMQKEKKKFIFQLRKIISDRLIFKRLNLETNFQILIKNKDI